MKKILVRMQKEYWFNLPKVQESQNLWFYYHRDLNIQDWGFLSNDWDHCWFYCHSVPNAWDSAN